MLYMSEDSYTWGGSLAEIKCSNLNLAVAFHKCQPLFWRHRSKRDCSETRVISWKITIKTRQFIVIVCTSTLRVRVHKCILMLHFKFSPPLKRSVKNKS